MFYCTRKLKAQDNPDILTQEAGNALVTLKSFPAFEFFLCSGGVGGHEGPSGRPRLHVVVFYVHVAGAEVTRKDAVVRIYGLSRWPHLPLTAHKNKTFQSANEDESGPAADKRRYFLKPALLGKMFVCVLSQLLSV